MVYDFGCAVSDGIHFLNPCHLILRLKLFGHTFLFSKLANEQVEHLLRIAIDLSEILLQLSADEELIVNAVLMYFLNGFVNDLTVAEELMEDTFVRLYTKKPRYSEKSSFKTWLYGIGRNVAREHLHRERKSRTTPLDDQAELSDDTYEPESSFFRNEQYRELHRALKKLKTE